MTLSVNSCKITTTIIDPVSPNISLHILHTVLYTLPKFLTRRICLTITSFFLLMIISFILVTLMCDSGGISWGEKVNRPPGGREEVEVILKEISWILTTLRRDIQSESYLGQVSQSRSLHILLQSAMYCKYSLKLKGYTKIGCATPDTKNH